LAVKGGDYAFFPGCRLGAAHPELVLKPFAVLKERLNAGLILNCCGISAWWAGEEEKFNSHTEALRSIWTELGKPTLITACMSCDKMLAAFLPEIKTVSLYTVLRELGISGEASSRPVLSVFDPCAANGRNDIKDDVRALVTSCGAELTGYSSDGKCCGNGGHMRFADNNLYDEIVQNRISESEAPFAVYCANCRETFRDAGKDSVHVLELLFGIDAGRSSLEEKRENVLKLKEHFTGVTASRENPWANIAASASDDVIAKMNALLVPMGDVKAAIYDCMNGGGGFRNESGDILTCRDFGAVVLWVSFREENGGYTVTDVYTHRMHVRQEG
ncbi:MAG: (Fe-S)-binding protein, partial [Oscillospiraceae bacterium]|nr:(Fe-S)-binding protein [Oscillospiraceae bacterium]